MNRLDKILGGAVLAVWAVVLVALLAGCASRVRPGVGVSNDGQRVGLDLGTYDTSFAHPVTGVAPGEECPGGVCGVPDAIVPVRASQIRAAQERASATPPVVWFIGGVAVLALAGLAYVVFKRGAK